MIEYTKVEKEVYDKVLQNNANLFLEQAKLIERLGNLSVAYLLLDRKLNIAIGTLVEFESYDSAEAVRRKARKTLKQIMELK